MKFDPGLYSKTEIADFGKPASGIVLPSSVSWKDYAPYPQDQGHTGTSPAWATTYGTLTIEWARQLGLKDKFKITVMAFCPFFSCHQLKDPYDYSCRSGVSMHDALNVLRTYGAKRFYLPVYTCRSRVDEAVMRNARLFRIKSFRKLFGYPEETAAWSHENFFKLNIDKVTPVKQALASGHAVPFGMLVPASFFYATDLWEPTDDELALLPELMVHGHALCAVGYDDSKYGGAFEVMNSWGEKWGNGGFCWVKYADFKKFVTDAYYIELYGVPSAPELGCVMGDCQSGYGKVMLENGDEYEGSFAGGRYDGYGIYIWSSGEVYGGQWRAGRREGLGVSIMPGGPPCPEFWQDDAPRHAMPDAVTGKTGCMSGDCSDGFGTFQYHNGTYTGTFSRGLKHGFGTFRYHDATTITGTWAADQIDGFGKLVVPHGWVYVGEFSHSLQSGYGLQYDGEGRYAAGEWLIGVLMAEKSDSPPLGSKAASSGKLAIATLKPKTGEGINICMWGNCSNGFGTMRYDTGDTYSGYFKEGRRDGYGIYIWLNGANYEGAWLADNMDGVGKIVLANGSCFIGEFGNGLQDGHGFERNRGTFTAGVWRQGKYQEGNTSLSPDEFSMKGAKGADLVKATSHSPVWEKTIQAVAAKKAVVK